MDRIAAQVFHGMRDRFVPVRLGALALTNALGPVLETDVSTIAFQPRRPMMALVADVCERLLDRLPQSLYYGITQV